ncbi:hypothetical protein ASG12_06645 [Williamsia sp. Leaf354]|uniref:cytochrome C oxidase subunit IV family protein n=1 Tax=Williamsia sp. Leaf354 TaxID=1736349 RepID=UPI0006F3341B|nr:cytochrome C oxidase subunit IV family protein [Williamsia sp. Leaf354]KQS00554.1 hypothetical protein ASG12_06645 [Williamsia sp. Leaf354]
MTPPPDTRSLRVVWIVAVVLTLIAAIETSAVTGRPLIVGVALIVVTLVKIALVMAEYMEIRHAPVWLRAGAMTWIVATAVVLLSSVVWT